MCVKCHPDGELPDGRSAWLYQGARYMFRIPLLHIDNRMLYQGMDVKLIRLPAMRSFKDYCKGGIFYEKNEDTIYRFLL